MIFQNNSLPYRIWISLQVFISILIIFTLFRIVFFLFFINEMWNLSAEYILKSFFLGFRFDARLAVIVILPFLLLSWILRINGRLFKKIWYSYWILIFSVILCFYIADFGYFSYLNTRLDASIIGLIKNVFISASMIWETYPVIPIIFLIAIIIFGFLKRIKQIYSNQTDNIIENKKSVLIYIVSIIIFLGIGYGKWSRYPLRWSDAFYSTNHVANQLAINPVLYLELDIKVKVEAPMTT